MHSRLSSIKSVVLAHFSERWSSYFTAFVLAIGLVGGAGCAPVAPYERGKLAHPTMTAGDLAGFGESHLRAITEGAIGGSGGTGSGCGCN